MSSAKLVGLSQSGRLGFLVKDSLLYGGAAAISKAFALITFPLLARHFSVTDYGALDYYLVLTSLLTMFFIFGQDSAVARYFYEYENPQTQQQLISQSLTFQLIVLSILTPLLWIGADRINMHLIEFDNSITLFKIVILQLPFFLLINFSQNLLKWTFVRTQFLIMTMGFTLLQASLLLIAVLLFDVEVRGVLIVSLITSSVFGVLGLIFVRKWLTIPTDLRILREILPFALPAGLISVAGAFSPTLERTLTSNMLGVDQLGLYAAATKIAMLSGLFISAFQTAWGPFSLSLYKNSDAGQTYNWVLKLFTLGTCLTALLITLMAQPLILILATDRFEGSILVLFPLVMGLSIQAISWITEIGIGLSKRNYLNLFSFLTALVGTLLGIWLLVPEFGLLGVGLGVLIGHTCRAIVASWLAQKVYWLPWQYAPVIVVVLLTLVFGLISLWSRIKYGTIISNWILLISIVFILLFGWRILLTRPERIKVTTLLRKILAKKIAKIY